MSEFERLVKWIDFKSSRQKDWLYPRLRKKGYGEVVGILEHNSSSPKANTNATEGLVNHYSSDPQFWIEMVNLRNGWRNHESTTRKKRENPTVKLSCDVLNQTRIMIKELANQEDKTQGEIVDRLIEINSIQGDMDYSAEREKAFRACISNLENFLSNAIAPSIQRHLTKKAKVESVPDLFKKYFRDFAHED